MVITPKVKYEHLKIRSKKTQWHTKIITLLFGLRLSDFQALYDLFSHFQNFTEFCPLWGGGGTFHS